MTDDNETSNFNERMAQVITDALVERNRLRKQVTELQAANTALVERARKAEGALAAVVRRCS